ncbi:MAG: hypothetical protein IT372_08105 [Polyangiaceae bacterium]|nr:hypothetical protein [Polyangiaceae bacterium]
MKLNGFEALATLLTITGIVRGRSRMTIPLGPDLAVLVTATPRKLGAAFKTHTAAGPLTLGPVTTPIA